MKVDALQGDFNAALDSFRAGDFEAAAGLFETLLNEPTGAREAAFNLGLARFKLGQLDAARKAFDLATLSDVPQVTGQAHYGKALCDHIEALSQAEADPKTALEKTQQALRKYHDVLTLDPKYAPARDGRQKAANLWTAVKEAIEQQPEQPGGDGQNDEESENQEEPNQQAPQQGSQASDSQSSDKSTGPPQNGNANSEQEAADQEQENRELPEEEPNDNAIPSDDQQATEMAENGNSNAAQAPDGELDNVNRNDNVDQDASSEEKTDVAEPANTSPASNGEQQGREQALRQLRQLMDRQRLNERNRRPWEPPDAARPVEKDW